MPAPIDRATLHPAASRWIELWNGQQALGWDYHGTNPNEDIRDGLTNKCRVTDQAVAALIRDLKHRGLLDETIIVWGGEFGRTPFREGRTAAGSVLGRDHHPHCFSSRSLTASS